MPFGAFGDLLQITDVAETGRPADLLRAAHDSLTGDGGELLFVVDDAHQLDHLSATLLYQLALSRSARLLVTVRADTELPDAVAALSADELLTQVEVEPLDRPATAALLESALGAPPDAAVTDEVFHRSQGNPLYLRHLVQGGELENGPRPAGPDRRLPGRPADAGAHGAGLPRAGRAVAPRRPGGAGRRACRRGSGNPWCGRRR